MEELRKKVQFFRDVKENKVDFGDNLSIGMVVEMRKLRLWFNDVDFPKTRPVDKCISYLLPVLPFVFCTNALSYLFHHYSEESIADIMLKLSHIFVLYGVILLMYLSIVHRREISLLLEFLNVKSLAILKQNKNHRPIRNRAYLFLLTVKLMLLCGSILAPVPYIWETYSTGAVYFKSAFPLDKTPHSLSVYIQTAVHVVIVSWTFYFSHYFVVVVFEFFVVIGSFYKNIASELRTLRRPGTKFNEDEEYLKLCKLLAECSEVQRYLDVANRCFWSFMALLIILSSFLTGLLLAVTFTINPYEALVYLIYPINISMLGTAVCLLGHHVTDSAEEMKIAIYDCDWYSAPRPFRKLVLMFLIRCEKPILVGAGPYYTLNLMLLTKIAKTIYSILTLARHIMK